ncbi:AAA domain-containing protein [Streptomyces sp. NBC_00016]|uniref:AAA domain-containing protein n=1 Tax=Streptomyces sp. NBC_00016 TaxID=2975622 RepID=UPI003246FED6
MEECKALIERLFCSENAQFEGYTLEREPEVVVPERLVRATLNRRTDADDRHDTYELTVFRHITGLAGELWEHTARNLLRVGALNHPALPQIAMGKFVPSEDIAFTLTRERGRPIDIDRTVAWAKRNPVRAFEHFSILLDALKELHAAGIIHRNLTAGSLTTHVIDMAKDPDEVAIILSRFEMSTLIGNVIRTVGAGSGPDNADEVRQFYTAPVGIEPERHLAFLAPELHSYLFDEHTSVRRDWVSTDIFGLAATVWEWFCGPVPDVLPEQYAQVKQALPTDRKAALGRLQRAMVSHLPSADLPAELTQALRRMLETHPKSRWNAYEAAKHLETHWQGIRGHWAAPDQKTPRLVAFLPDWSVQMLHEDRKWIQHSPATQAGQEELRFFLEHELAEAELVHSPRGALGYATGPDDTLKEAEWVLIGQRAVWFCAVLFDPVPMSTERKHFEEVLLIKYLRDKDITLELVTNQRRRKIEGGLKVIPFRPGQDLSGAVRGHRPWTDLQEAVRAGAKIDTLNEMYLRSLQFLLGYQHVVLKSRSYPFRTVGQRQGTVTIEFDETADAERRHASPMLSAYALDERRRPRFGDFFTSLHSERDGKATVLNVVRRGSSREPYFGGTGVTAVFREQVDADTIRVTVQGGGSIPQTGWIRHTDDAGTGPQLDRQERALKQLRVHPLLIESLRAPFSFDLGRGRWIDSRPFPGEVEFDGASRKLIERLLGTHPFFALQGPPGSGKSTLTAAAVRRNLAVEQGARILVTSQSNHTLDGLARKLIQQQGPRTLILRETAAGKEDEVRDPLVRAHTLTHLTRTVRDASTRLLQARLDRKEYEQPPYADRPYTEDLLKLAEEWGIDLERLVPLKEDDPRRELAKQWLEHITSDQIELGDRIRSGASVILATCSIAAIVNDGRWDPKDLFDWVIVEEAAKAWSTEIIVPLVLGVRWTLIGDHFQLGPHREEELEAFLTSLRNHPDPLVAMEYEQKDGHLGALRLFKQVFVGKTAKDYQQADSAVGRIENQFRMDKTIAEPVSRAFYPKVPAVEEIGMPVSFLNTEKHKPHGLTAPGFLRGRPLVWVDTSGCEGFGDEPRWRNPGEVDLVDRLAQLLKPLSAPSDQLDADDSLAILTPYKAQLELLGGRDSLRGREYTVHAFQGREADRVIVSLVRSTAVPGASIERNMGHVGRRELINVMMSRAQRLLIVVGNLQHFTTYGGEHWATVAKVLRHYGTVISADEVGS